MTARLPALLACLLALAGPAAADEGLERAIADFVTGPGWTAQDPEVLESALDSTLSPNGALRPSANLSALEKALLILEGRETALERTRTLLRYGQVTLAEDGALLPVSFIQVERYNLGPLLHQLAVEEYGAENVADPEDFGVGPHVAWRFVFMPVTGNEAQLLEAARSEVAEQQAARTPCLDRPCLDLFARSDELHAWKEIQGPPTGFESLYEAWQDEIAVNARIAAELALPLGLATVEDGSYVWTGSEQPEAAPDGRPYLFLQIDRNLGQALGSDAILAATALNDHALSAFWVRRVEYPGHLAWQSLTVTR